MRSRRVPAQIGNELVDGGSPGIKGLPLHQILDGLVGHATLRGDTFPLPFEPEKPSFYEFERCWFHVANPRPYLGLLQAHNKTSFGPSLAIMSKQGKSATTRRRKVASAQRVTVAANVRARARVQFPLSKNLPLSIWKASAEAKTERISLSHVKRILNGDRQDVDAEDKTSVTLEQLDLLARALDLQPYQILMPGLDAKNPQVARGAVIGESEVYAIQELVKRAVQEELAATIPPAKAKVPAKATK